jgi:hypothetical protein
LREKKNSAGVRSGESFGWLVTTLIAIKCASLSWLSEQWHFYAKGTNLAFSFDIVAY